LETWFWNHSEIGWENLQKPWASGASVRACSGGRLQRRRSGRPWAKKYVGQDDISGGRGSYLGR